MKRTALALSLLVTPAFGEAQLDFAIEQYTQCIRRAYLAEAAGQQFIADRNVTTAAERAVFACQTEERNLGSVLTVVFDQTDWGSLVASRIKQRLKNDLERWFTDLNSKVQAKPSINSRWPSQPMPMAPQH